MATDAEGELARQKALESFILTHIDPLTLSEASRRLGVRPSYLAGVISGAYGLSKDVAARFASTFNADVETLTTLAFMHKLGQPWNLSTSSQRFATRYLHEALRAIRELQKSEAALDQPRRDSTPISIILEDRTVSFSLPYRLADLLLEEIVQVLQDILRDTPGETTLSRPPKNA